MLKKSLILLVLIAFQLSIIYAQSISRNIIASSGGTLSSGGFSINYNIGEPMIASFSTAGNIITQGFEQPDDSLLNSITASLNLTAFLEGFYIDINTMRPAIFDLGMSRDPSETDTLLVNLWSPANLQNAQPDHSLKAVIHTNGTASMLFPASVNGDSYYISVRHRNHIETWSANPVVFIAETNYDFSSSPSQAYDDGVDANPPMAAVAGGKFAFYGGDVNQDGGVDGQDASTLEIDVNAFAFGYNVSDANGDGSSDGLDASLIEVNSNLFIFYSRP